MLYYTILCYAILYYIIQKHIILLLHNYIIKGHVEVVELLLSKGADVRPGKFTALHAAAGNGQALVVRRLAMEFFPKELPFHDILSHIVK